MAKRGIRVKYLKLGREKVWGFADISKKLIELDERLKGKKHLEILTHEALHIFLPEATEEEIVRLSVGLTEVLWKERYRRIDDSLK